MTACTNKARGAVVAALAGALALGAAPAVALAQGREVSTLAVTGWGAADIATAEDGDNGSVTYADGLSFDLGSHKFLVPTSIASDKVTFKLKSGDYELSYFGAPLATNASTAETDGYYNGLVDGGWYKVGGGTEVYNATSGMSLEMAKEYFSGTLTSQKGIPVKTMAGNYSVVAIKDGEKTKSFYFEVKAVSSLEGAYLYLYDSSDPNNTSDTDFTFNNTDLLSQIKVADKDGKALGASIAWRTPNGASITLPQAATVAGSYTAVVSYGGETKEISVEVKKLDLSTAIVTYDDVTGAGNFTNADFIDRLKVNGESIDSTASKLAYYLEVVSRKDVNGSNTDYTAMGPYEVVVGVDEDKLDDYIPQGYDLRGSITGEATVRFARLDTDVFASGAKLMYGDEEISAGEDIDLSAFGGEGFDASKLRVVYGDRTFSGSDLEVTVDGDVTAKGDHNLRVRVVPKKVDGKWIGGFRDIAVHVSHAELDADERLYFYFDGKLAGNGTEVTYDGSDQLEKLQVVVKDADGNDVDPSNYDVKVTRDGKEVDSATDAGTYEVTVTGKTFDFDEGVSTFTLKVNPVVVDSVVPVWDVDLDESEIIDGYLTYTGDVLTPSYTFYDADGNVLDIPAEAYDVTYSKGGKKDVELKEVGTYDADFDTAVDVTNYVVDATTKVYVTDKGVFLDVPTNEWYSQAVYDAKNLGYMNGDGNGYLFNPSRALTRAEAVCVLFNMAGGSDFYADATIPGYDPEGKVFETGFSDVAGNEFYAKAIAWAKATAIVNGYADGTFGVSRNVTSEEFACMLANFERAKGGDTTVDADAVLADYADAGSVSDWAKDSVAWAVSEGVMGNSAELAPSGSILRMRVAAMVTNYQPRKLEDLVIAIKDTNQLPTVNH